MFVITFLLLSLFPKESFSTSLPDDLAHTGTHRAGHNLLKELEASVRDAETNFKSKDGNSKVVCELYSLFEQKLGTLEHEITSSIPHRLDQPLKDLGLALSRLSVDIVAKPLTDEFKRWNRITPSGKSFLEMIKKETEEALNKRIEDFSKEIIAFADKRVKEWREEVLKILGDKKDSTKRELDGAEKALEIARSHYQALLSQGTKQ